MFPEGATSNGQYLCSFKKGAFGSLLPVQPFVHNNHQHVLTNENHIIIFLGCCGYPFRSRFFHWLPIFEPNEYFWKHHWEPNQATEKKVDTYARVIREIMLKNSHLKDGNQFKAEDRFEFMAKYKGLKTDSGIKSE
jgi:hypothetical protein